MTPQPKKTEQMTPKTKTKDPKKCKHQWKEDPDFASGIMIIVSGSPKDLGQETRVICRKCGEVKYVRMKDLGSLMDMYERAKND